MGGKDGYAEIAVPVVTRSPVFGVAPYERDVPQIDAQVTSERYVWVPMAVSSFPEGDIGVWSHESIGGDRTKVLRELIEGYRPLARVER